MADPAQKAQVPRQKALLHGSLKGAPTQKRDGLAAVDLVMKFLVVDDDPVILDLMTEILNGYGYDDVTTAENGADALEILRRKRRPFDCLMLDIQMPGMGGIELCRRIRDLRAYADVPILMITAMSDKPYIDFAFAAGASDYVVKPFDVLDLMGRVKEIEASGRTQRRTAQAAAEAPAGAQQGFDLALPLETSVNGFIRQPVLENYARTILTQRNFPMAAVLITLPELREAHAQSSADGFYQLLCAVAREISNSFVGTQAFMSYLGSGRFLCVCDETRLMAEGELQRELQAVLTGDEFVQRHKLPVPLTVRVAAKATPKVFEKPKELKFIDRALEDKDPKTAPQGALKGRSIKDRLRSIF